jgi:biofilm PGA synthesis N-glycosyltransferase PgaC
MQTRLLVISPVRNEADHIERVVNAMARQTRVPDAWVVVDDCSDDGTSTILHSLEASVPFLTLVSAPPAATLDGAKDRLARAAAPRAFNLGLETVDWPSFTHIGKLDGDIELPPDYFERLLPRFAADPALGLAGGVLVEEVGAGARRIRIPEHHVHGALKLYTRECFEAIDGLRECLGWDTIDGVYARMRGFKTRSFSDIVALHHREWGSADGKLRGRARHGECAYIAGYPLPWVTLRSAKLATVKPRGLSGAAFLYGYLRARLTRAPHVTDPEYRRFVRSELRQRMLRPLTPHAR